MGDKNKADKEKVKSKVLEHLGLMSENCSDDDWSENDEAYRQELERRMTSVVNDG